MSGIQEVRRCMRPGSMCPPDCRATCPDWQMLQELAAEINKAVNDVSEQISSRKTQRKLIALTVQVEKTDPQAWRVPATVGECLERAQGQMRRGAYENRIDCTGSEDAAKHHTVQAACYLLHAAELMDFDLLAAVEQYIKERTNDSPDR